MSKIIKQQQRKERLLKMLVLICKIEANLNKL